MTSLSNFNEYIFEQKYISEDGGHIVTITVFEIFSDKYVLDVTQRESNNFIPLGIITLVERPVTIFSRSDYTSPPEIQVEWESNDVIIVNGNRIELLLNE